MAQPVAGVCAGGLDDSDAVGNFHSPGGVVGQSFLGAQVVLGGGSGKEVAAHVEGPGALGQTVLQGDDLGILAVGDGNAVLGLGDLSLAAVVVVLGGAQRKVGTACHDDDLVAGLQRGNIGNQSGGVACGLGGAGRIRGGSGIGGIRGSGRIRGSGGIGGFPGGHLGHIGSGVDPQLIALEIADNRNHIHSIAGGNALQRGDAVNIDGGLTLGQGRIAGGDDVAQDSALDQNPGALQSAHILVSQQLSQGHFLHGQLGSAGLGELSHAGELLQAVVGAALTGSTNHIAHGDVSGSGIEIQVDTAGYILHHHIPAIHTDDGCFHGDVLGAGGHSLSLGHGGDLHLGFGGLLGLLSLLHQLVGGEGAGVAGGVAGDGGGLVGPELILGALVAGQGHGIGAGAGKGELTVGEGPGPVVVAGLDAVVVAALGCDGLALGIGQLDGAAVHGQSPHSPGGVGDFALSHNGLCSQNPAAIQRCGGITCVGDQNVLAGGKVFRSGNLGILAGFSGKYGPGHQTEADGCCQNKGQEPSCHCEVLHCVFLLVCLWFRVLPGLRAHPEL